MAPSLPPPKCYKHPMRPHLPRQRFRPVVDGTGDELVALGAESLDENPSCFCAKFLCLAVLPLLCGRTARQKQSRCRVMYNGSFSGEQLLGRQPRPFLEKNGNILRFSDPRPPVTNVSYDRPVACAYVQRLPWSSLSRCEQVVGATSPAVC